MTVEVRAARPARMDRRKSVGLVSLFARGSIAGYAREGVGRD